MARGIDTKPYLEWLEGAASAAVSPNTAHGIVIVTFLAIVNRCGGDFGIAMPELHLRLDDREMTRTVLLPDVAFFRNQTLVELRREDRNLPNVPPEVIVEVRSPNDRPGFREEKIRRYLAWGCPLVFDADPQGRTIVAHTQSGMRTFNEGDRFSDAGVSWLEFEVREVFARLDLLGF